MNVSRENPWPFEQWDAASRLETIRESSDVRWLLKVAAWPDNQAAVRAAAERRLRKLQRERVLS